MKIGMHYRIAETLGKAKDTMERGFHGEGVSHLWLCQSIAYELRHAKPNLNGYIFGKKCGYNFNLLTSPFAIREYK